jgi:small subunit ribosomal protein S1
LRSQTLDQMAEGSVVKGIVKNITDYGAFIDLGGMDGLLHITDMSWGRVKHPSEILNVGDEIDVKVLKFDQEKERVS